MTSGYQLEMVDGDGFGLLELMANVTGAVRFDTLAVDATLGNAVPISEAISSLMTDGGLTTIRSFGNRVAAFLVTITAPDTAALADGEAVLMSALDRVAALAWHVPFGASSFFDVVACWSEHQFDDLEEVRRLKRTFRVTFECLPFARSKDATTVTWTGGATNTLLNTTAGWTVVGGGTLQSVDPGSHQPADYYIQRSTTGAAITLRRSVLLDEFLWLKTPGPTPGPILTADYIVTALTVNGVTVPKETWRCEAVSSNHFYTIPTGTWRGETATVEFTLSYWLAGPNRAILYEFWTCAYPHATTSESVTQPMGFGIIDVPGTARAPFGLLQFTAPTGGAWLFTAPDPLAALRERGAIENLYEKMTIGGGDPVYLPGTYVKVTQRSQPQPPALHPNGIWPQYATEANKFAYPTVRGMAVSYFPAGAVSVISPSPTLPTGFHSDAIAFEEHVLHPGRCGFGVIAASTGLPVSATFTFYRRWKHHAAE